MHLVHKYMYLEFNYRYLRFLTLYIPTLACLLDFLSQSYIPSIVCAGTVETYRGLKIHTQVLKPRKTLKGKTNNFNISFNKQINNI